MSGDNILPGKAAEKAIEYALNPDTDRLCEFTVLSKGSTMSMACEMAKHRYFDRNRHIRNERGEIIRHVTIAELTLLYFMKLQRSVDGKCLNRSFDLAGFGMSEGEGYQDELLW